MSAAGAAQWIELPAQGYFGRDGGPEVWIPAVPGDCSPAGASRAQLLGVSRLLTELSPLALSCS